MLNYGADFLLSNPAALHTDRCGGARAQVEGVTLAGKRLGPVLVQNYARVQL